MLLDELKGIVGSKGWTADPIELEPHLTEWRRAVVGATPIMVMPSSTAQVAAVVRACAAADVAVVPQGGNTGMCAGAVPDESGTQILLSLSRMNRILSVDADNFSMEVEAGCILENIQNAALAADRYFPLSLGAEGSCQIGGNLSTNAGGINVVRYGTARAQVLGIEVVLADGTVVNSLRALRKDTAGYDLKQLFIGSEGTLGIITAAVLKLYPHPGATTTVLVALASSATAVSLLAHLRTSLGDTIEAFELISDRVFALLEKHIEAARLPFERRYPWYVLLEVAAGRGVTTLETALATELDTGVIENAVVAKSLAEAQELWRLRHSIAEVERQEGIVLKHDISVPVSKMATFLARGEQVLQQIVPEAELFVFGHVGDGNLHYNILLPDGYADSASVTAAVYDLVTEIGGSVSAEHGIGRLKKEQLSRYRSDPELHLMKVLKQALDPLNILNPGKVI